MRMLSRIPIALRLAAALLAVGGCGDGSTEPKAVVTVDVAAGRDTIPNTDAVRIDYVVRNRGTSPVTVVTCQGFTIATVERRTSAGWQLAALPGCPDAPFTDVVVAAGASHAAFVPISGAGTWRVKVWRRPDEQSSEPFIISPGFVVR